MTDTSRGIACYCPYWHSDAVAKVARATDTANRHMALDSADSLTRDINARFHPSNQMPVTTSPSAAMSASMSDNYTRGAQYRRRNNTADQSATTGEELLRLIQQTLPNWSDPEIDAFVGAQRVAERQRRGSRRPGGMRLPDPDNGGRGASPGVFFTGQGTHGTFAESDNLTSPRATADQRPRTARDRRLAHDRRSAPNIEQRCQNHADFLTRFPMAGRTSISGR